ncbi:MAG: 30S ribosomal protein S24e [Methanospirillaceae archaeon]|nr:30S ribosomal protein S24e [Methanospirillaceae archaeon]
MEFTITKDNQNELLSRREIEFVLVYDGATPSRALVLGKLAALMNANMDQVVIDSFKTAFGVPRMHGAARIYSDKKTRDKCELPYMLKRGMKDEPGTEEAEDAPAGTATAEASEDTEA